jgi:hypothetical protein
VTAVADHPPAGQGARCACRRVFGNTGGR